MSTVPSPVQISRLLEEAEQLRAKDGLMLARLLLDSVPEAESEEEADWSNMSLAAFEKGWDNAEDAVYDN